MRVMLRRVSALFCSRKPLEVGETKETRLEKHFIDRVRIRVKAGDGGNGAYAFYADRWVSKGPADGGCGGAGGDICLQASRSLIDLHHFRRKDLAGNDGTPGAGKGRDGRNGGKLIYKVPVGTLVYELRTNEEQNQTKHLIGDLDSDKKELRVAKGGENGKGNKRFPSLDASHRKGKPGQERHLYLELKSLAQVGLVGLPNVGKSTLLAALTRALPKIANYEFTTLHPSVGVMRFVDDVQISIADIPGIIEDAHLNKGLGLEFLRHIERTKTLLFVLDVTRSDPVGQFELLKKQLQMYDKHFLRDRNSIVVLSKSDCSTNSLEVYEYLKNAIRQPVFLISGKLADGLEPLVVCIRKFVLDQIEKEDQAATTRHKQP